MYSGSTVCTAIFNGTKLYCANSGDSRAIKVGINSTGLENSVNRKSNSIYIFNWV